MNPALYQQAIPASGPPMMKDHPDNRPIPFLRPFFRKETLSSYFHVNKPLPSFKATSAWFHGLGFKKGSLCIILIQMEWLRSTWPAVIYTNERMTQRHYQHDEDLLLSLFKSVMPGISYEYELHLWHLHRKCFQGATSHKSFLLLSYHSVQYEIEEDVHRLGTIKNV